MNIKKIILELRYYVKDLFSDMQAIYIEKGPEPFKKPVLYAFLSVLISYLLYSSNIGTIKNNKMQLEKTKKLSGFYNEYTDLKSMIKKYSKMVPSIKDKDEFLNYFLNTTASKYGITFTNIDSQKELKFDNIYFVSKQVQFSTDYETLGNFIKEIENYMVFVEVSQLSVTKKNNEIVIGKLDVSLNISTVFVERI